MLDTDRKKDARARFGNGLFESYERKHMTTQLAKKNCTPCEKETAPLKGEDLRKLSQQLGNDWKVVNEHHLEKNYTFKDFREALEFTNQVGELAEKQGHHPEIILTWGEVRLRIWTHNIGGLSENDFILAAKVDEI
jgi:4a-hydroxytetrahydrobiopterin dehydratase